MVLFIRVMSAEPWDLKALTRLWTRLKSKDLKWVLGIGEVLGRRLCGPPATQGDEKVEKI